MTTHDLLRGAAYCDQVFEFLTKDCSEEDKSAMRAFLEDGKKHGFTQFWFQKHGLHPVERFGYSAFTSKPQ